MSLADIAVESPRRSLRRSSAIEPKQPSVEHSTLKSPTGNGKKRCLEDDAPVLDSPVSSVKEEVIEDEDEEESGGPPPLKKVARTSGAGGAIMWKTATGAPKQLAFRKIAAPASNGSSAKSTTTTAPAAPLNLATALAGLLPHPTITTSSSLPTMFPKRQLVVKQPGMVPRLTSSISSPSTSHLVRRRIDKVNNEICNSCVKALPSLRRSLGRLETRMEAVTSMIKQIVNKHSQQNVSFTRMSSALPRGGSAMASPSSSSLNGNRVAGKPTAMRFVPISGRNAAGPSNSQSVMRKFVAEKNGRLPPGSLMYRMISRGLLTYRSPVLTADEYYKQAPNVIKAHTLRQVQQVMEDLVASGLYRKSDASVNTLDPECIFEKETDMTKLDGLSEYGVATADFLPDGFDD